MPQTKHTRIITDEQFSEFTTVDGTRIDRALEDTVSFFNSMPPSAIKTRFIPQDRVWGWMPEPSVHAATFDLVITSGGTGYLTATGDTPTSASLAGTNMTVDLATTAGVVTGATINNAGTNYVPGEVITPTRYVGTITAAGATYVNATNVATTVAPAGGTGLTLDITVGGGGAITGVKIRDCGTGYTTGDVLSVTGGDGAGRVQLTISAGDCSLTLMPKYRHHWPWVGTWNREGRVATGSSVPSSFLNDFRIKGTLTSGIINQMPDAGTAWPLGEQFAWTTELFVGKPAVFDALQLMLCQDHRDSVNKPFGEHVGFGNFEWSGPDNNAGAIAGMPATDMQLVVQVADTFDSRIRAKDSAEIQRHTFMIKMDSFSWHRQEDLPTDGPGWDDMTPTLYPGGAIRGAVIQLNELNIPIHQNAIVRVSIVIPRYKLEAWPSNGPSWWGREPWGNTYYTMSATMLEEVE